MLPKARTYLLALAPIFAPALACAQQVVPASTGLKSASRIIIDGVSSPGSTNIYVDSNVSTEESSSASVIGKGNTLVFTPNSNFRTLQNAYWLKSGGSKVASYTGMSAKVGGPECFFWVTPVDSNLMTLYEVNWSSNSVWVYARSYDVYITRREHPQDNNLDDKHRWLVKAGQTARISDVQLCEPLIAIWPVENINTAIELGATTAVVATIPLWPPKPSMSPDHPSGP